MSYSEKIFGKWVGKHNTDPANAASKGMPTNFTAAVSHQPGGGIDALKRPTAASAKVVSDTLRSQNPQAKDPFLRKPTRSRQFVKKFTTYSFPVRMSGVFAVGFAFGAVIEVFACKTMLYESVSKNKDKRRHEFDNFVVEFRQNVDKWQEEDRKRV